MKKNKLYRLAMSFAFSLTATAFMSSCLDDLNRYPTNDITSEKVYSTFWGISK